MKRIFSYGVLSVAAFALFFAVNTSDKNQDNKVFNLLALNEAYASEQLRPTCYSTTGSCWIFSCWDVYRCTQSGVCPTVSVDEADDKSRCGS